MLPRSPTPLYMDNHAAIEVSEQKFPKMRRYIDLRHHYLGDHIEHVNMPLHHVPSALMLADPFTRPLKPDPSIVLSVSQTSPRRPARQILH